MAHTITKGVDSSNRDRRERNRYVLPAICGLLVLAVALVFGQTLRHEFVNFDDDKYVFDNPHITKGVTLKSVRWAIAGTCLNVWHPLTSLSFLLDAMFYGVKHPGGYHLTNVLLHAATAVLLFLTLRSMTKATGPSALVAMIFAIHPLRVESVAWITERKDVLSVLFFVLTLAAYHQYARHPFSVFRYLLVLVVFAMGLMAKPMLVTLPLVLLLLDYWPLDRFAARSIAPIPAKAARTPGHSALYLVLEKVPLLALSVACGLATLLLQGKPSPAMENPTLLRRIEESAISYVAYLQASFFPRDLAVTHPPLGDDGLGVKAALALTVLTAISLAAFVLRRRAPYLLVGWCWYVGMLAPVIGLVPSEIQRFAYRYTYLPQIGVCLAVVWGAWQVVSVWSPRRSRWHAASAAAVTATLMVCAWWQTTFWRDTDALWRHTLACASQNAFAHNTYGAALAVQGRLDEAIGQFRKAIDIAPCNSDARNRLGVALARQRQIDDAISQFEKAIELTPNYADAHYNLGFALTGRGQLDAAISHYRKVLELNPDYARAHANLGSVLARSGQVEAAIAHLTVALETDPDDTWNLNYIAWIRATHPDAGYRDGGEAVALAERTVAIAPGNPAALDTLAAAYAEAGRFAEAVQTADRAVRLASDAGNRGLAKQIEARLELFRNKQPYRQSPIASPKSQTGASPGK